MSRARLEAEKIKSKNVPLYATLISVHHGSTFFFFFSEKETKAGTRLCHMGMALC